MKYKIGFTLRDGTTDCIVIEGNTLTDIQKQAHTEIEKRDAIDPWSQELENNNVEFDGIRSE